MSPWRSWDIPHHFSQGDFDFVRIFAMDSFNEGDQSEEARRVMDHYNQLVARMSGDGLISLGGPRAHVVHIMREDASMLEQVGLRLSGEELKRRDRSNALAAYQLSPEAAGENALRAALEAYVDLVRPCGPPAPSSKPGSPNMFGLLQSEKNAIGPRKRPLSAMTPTIVSQDGRLRLVVGSPGGPKIINTVLQTILNVVDFEMDLQQAVDFPRFHHQWMPDELYVESYGFSPDTIRLLEERGHRIRTVEDMGRVMAIEVTDEGLVGAADARSEGSCQLSAISRQLAPRIATRDPHR